MLADLIRVVRRSAFAATLLPCVAQAAEGDPSAVLSALPGPVLCDPKPPASEFLRGDLCKRIAAMREPAAPVEGMSRAAGAYRLLYFRSFDDPIAVRLEIYSDTEAKLFVKEMFARTERLRYARTAFLTRAQIAAFRKLVADQNFWAAPSIFNVDEDLGPFTAADRKRATATMTDGATWIVEGLDAQRYHVMTDDGGAFESPVQAIGLSLLDLAKTKIPVLNVEPVY
jgi:hypothetical protein